MLTQEIIDAFRKTKYGIDKGDNLWDAAVLVPLMEIDGKTHILFEVRSQSLRRQPGEICFPGGHFEESDVELANTAIREATEELGITQADIQLIAPLDILVTNKGPILHPFLGQVKTRNFALNKSEVESVFTVPLQWLLTCTPEIGYIQLADKPREDFPFHLVPLREKNWRVDKEYPVYFYIYQDKVIWGMTARILHSFLEKYKDILRNY